MSVQEYLDKHMLSRRIEDAVNAAVRAKTPDPVLFISNHMRKSVPSVITKVKARQILDSRGIPTVEVDLHTNKGVFRASAPSGTTSGMYEAVELRDGEKGTYLGNGVNRAVKNINEKISVALVGMDPTLQSQIDQVMIDLDKTENKSELGVNAILAVSIAACKAGAAEKEVPLYKHIADLSGQTDLVLPVPVLTLLSGGKHAGNNLAIQEITILPVGAKTFEEALQMGSETYHHLKAVITEKYGAHGCNVGEDGGFAPNISSLRDGLDLVQEAIGRTGHNEKIKIAIGVAATEFCIGNGAEELSNNNTQPMDVDQAMEIHVQPEIVVEILSKLPVRSLQRFKCVSTYWGALISDPYFRKKHLNHANNDQSSHKLLICQLDLGAPQWTFYSSSLSSDHVVVDEEKLDCPSTCKPVSPVVFCSCDGLVLLEVDDRIDKQLLLWNPSTRESRVLPHPGSPLDDCVCGLGYDTIGDDYKILSANLNASISHTYTVEILALKSGSWRKIGKHPTGISRVTCSGNCGTDYLPFVHGSFHWLGQSRNYTIVSLNISNEVYGEIQLLESMRIHSWGTECGISVLRGMLCLYSTHENSLESTFKLWMLTDYGCQGILDSFAYNSKY